MEEILQFLAKLFLLFLMLFSPAEEEAVPTTPVMDGVNLTVHYLDVGQADSALIECNGEFLLIDGGNVEDGQMVVSYLDQQGVETLSALVCTHAHEDHVGGLPAVLAKFDVESVYAPVTEYSTKIYSNFVRYADEEGCGITIPSPGDSFTVGGAQVTVLGPVEEYDDPNNTSLVLMVEYGSSSFLFTGDMEVLAENAILDIGADVRADVLKVGHHGSETSSGYRFIYEVMADYCVISVGADNEYGHPHDAPLSRLKDSGAVIFRTDELGTVIARTDGTEISFTWENQSAQPEDLEPGDGAPEVYVGNRKSQRFHAPDCANLPKGDNRVEFDKYEDALAAGYTPCRSCLQ